MNKGSETGEGQQIDEHSTTADVGTGTACLEARAA